MEGNLKRHYLLSGNPECYLILSRSIVINKEFDLFLLDRDNKIYNAAHILLVELMRADHVGEDPHCILPWNMELIDALTSEAKRLLKEHNHSVCHPFYVDKDTMCYHTSSCDGHCPFKK